MTLQARRKNTPGSIHPLQPTSRIAGIVSALASDGDFLWVATSTANYVYGPAEVLVLHKPTNRWVGRFVADATACFAVDDKYLWLGNNLSYGNGAKCLQRLEKRQLYDIPESQWTSDKLSEEEASAAYGSLNDRERGLWHFDGGEYAEAANFLGKIEPVTAETLFLLGLCHDSSGLNEPEKARAFFQRILDEHPREPLAMEAETQLQRATSPEQSTPGSLRRRSPK